MGTLPTVRIVNPAKPDEFIVINESDFDESKHTLFEGGPPKAAPQSAERQADEEEGDGSGGPQLPEGYRIERSSPRSGYYFLYGPEDQLIEGPSNGKWQGQDGAILGAIEHADG